MIGARTRKKSLIAKPSRIGIIIGIEKINANSHHRNLENPTAHAGNSAVIPATIRKLNGSGPPPHGPKPSRRKEEKMLPIMQIATRKTLRIKSDLVRIMESENVTSASFPFAERK
jgi:hypothetical protein